MGVAGDGSGADLGPGDTHGVGAGYWVFAFWDIRKVTHLPGRSTAMVPGGAVTHSTRWSWISGDAAEERYCTSLRERPPATDVSANRHTAFGAIQAAYSTARAGEGHMHRRCRGPRARRGCNGQIGRG